MSRIYTSQDLTGQKFNRYTVLSLAHKDARRQSHWNCRCECGSQKVVRGDSLKNGKIKSCGCLNKELATQLGKDSSERQSQSKIDLTGKKFGRLTPVEWMGESKWKVKCDCGNERIVKTNALTSGVQVSCGCYKNDLKSAEMTARNLTHGMSHEAEYGNWKAMVDRCYRKDDVNYARYGGRGIAPCGFIAASPLNLILSIGKKPREDFQIDRIDNDKGYTCGKCPECAEKGFALNMRWVTCKVNARNKSNNKLFKIDGKTKCAAEWAEELGITWAQFVKKYAEHELTNA